MCFPWLHPRRRNVGHGVLARETIRKGRREISQGEAPTDRVRRPGAGRPRLEQSQPGLLAALEALVDPPDARRPDLAATLDMQESGEAGRDADATGVASEFDHRRPDAA